PVDAVNADAGGKGLARREQQEQQNQNQGQTLTSLVRVQAVLSPSEELEVFAAAGLDREAANVFPPPPIDNPPRLVKATLANLAAFRVSQDEKALQNSERAVEEAITTSDAAPLPTPGVQAFAAYLYARNNDIVFNNAPLAQIAA